MGVRIASSASTTIVNIFPVNATDTLIATTGALGLVQDNAQVLLNWYLATLTGAAATGITVKIRRGILVGSPVVNIVSIIAATASVTQQFSGCYVDSPGVVAGIQYSLWATVSGGAAVLTINDVCLSAMIL